MPILNAGEQNTFGMNRHQRNNRDQVSKQTCLPWNFKLGMLKIVIFFLPDNVTKTNRGVVPNRPVYSLDSFLRHQTMNGV